MADIKKGERHKGEAGKEARAGVADRPREEMRDVDIEDRHEGREWGAEETPDAREAGPVRMDSGRDRAEQPLTSRGERDEISRGER
jgi:hypothetical protein